MSVVSNILKDIPLPKMVRMRQVFDDYHLEDIVGTIKQQLSGFEHTIRPNMRIAITAGSRGISNISLILSTIVQYCKDLGAIPFLIPAMGSHGGATAEGQLALLATLGITEEACGCPIYSSMDTVEVAVSPEGTPVRIDRYAAEADGIILVNRIKPHPVFFAEYESGLFKMASIGIAKQFGAELFHQAGFEHFERLIPLHGNILMDACSILFGVGIIENAYDETCHIEAIAPKAIAAREPELLLMAKARMPRILPGSSDILVIDKMGKDISGDGMDPHITGRYAQFYTGKANFTARRVAVLDLTDASRGNFIGIEAADVTTQRLLDKADTEETYPNSLTSCGNQHMPMHMKNDKEAIQCAIKITTGIDWNNASIIRIQDTLHIGEILVSVNMLDSLQDIEGLEQISEPMDWVFNEDGNLW